MYQFLLGIQYLGILLLVATILYITTKKPSRRQQLILGAGIALLINFVGYLFEMRAQNGREALVAVKLIYFGKPYAALFMFVFQMDFCKRPIPKWFLRILLVMHIGVTCLVMTCQSQTLFYSSIMYVQTGIFPHLVFGHGVLYIAYYCVIGLYLLIGIVTAARRLLVVRTQDERVQLINLLCIDAIMGVGFIIFLSGITGGYDATLLSYLISVIMLCNVLFRYHLFDTMMVAKDIAIDELADALVVLDNEGIPIFSNYKADQILSSSDVYTMRELVQVMDDHIIDDKDLKIHNRSYRVASRILSQNYNICGKLYLISDVTEIERRSREITEQAKMMATLREEAEKDTEIRKLFSKSVALEIQRPIADIAGYLELLQNAGGSSSLLSVYEEMQDSLQVVEHILQDVDEANRTKNGINELISEQGGYVSGYESKHPEKLAVSVEPVDITFEEQAQQMQSALAEDFDADREAEEALVEEAEEMVQDTELAPGQLPEISSLKGINAKDGMVYCGDEMMYEIMLGEYYRNIDENVSEIKALLDAKNYSDYTVKVHALKSTSRMIGAGQLASWFEKMEKCGKGGDIATIEAETAMLLGLYQSYKKILEPFAEVGMDEDFFTD